MKSHSEPESKKRLQSSLVANYFSIHSEQRGQLQYAKPIKKLFDKWDVRRLKQKLVIDFVLEPKQALLDAGWDLGSVGVEAKPSPLVGSSFGKAFAQILDYQASIFPIRGQAAGQRELSMIFLLGPDRFHGTEASVLMQEGIGVIRISRNDEEVKFLHGNGMHPILTLVSNAVLYQRPRFGMGIGHR